MLEQDTTRKGQVDEKNITEFDAFDNKGDEYKIETI